jgi:hypothetical protein
VIDTCARPRKRKDLPFANHASPPTALQAGQRITASAATFSRLDAPYPDLDADDAACCPAKGYGPRQWLTE